jgi:cytochrome c553
MKKFLALAILVAFGFAAGFAGSVHAQKKHTPKFVWKVMLSNLSDVQGITSALTVFDMKRVGVIADGMAKRETFISTIERLPAKTRELHGKIGSLAGEISAAAKAGDDLAIGKKIGDILTVCSECHYNSRDASRRK